MISKKLIFALGSILALPLIGSAQEAASEPRTLAATASTAVPALVPYSGIAIDAQGKPLGEAVSVTFQVFKDEQGGESLFTETQTLNLDRLGRYKAQLGATYPSGIPLATFQSGEARWLEVQIAGQAPKPRTLLTSVPYALKAGDATTLGGLPVSAFALSGDTSHPATAQSVQSAAAPAGTVTSVGSGAGLTGGPITKSGTLSIANGGVTNAMLHESTLTIKAGTGLAGGGSVSLGGSTTLSLGPNISGTSGKFSGATTPVLSGANTNGASGQLGTTVGGEPAGVWGSSSYYGVYGAGTYGVFATASNVGVYAAGNVIGVSGISNNSGGWGEIGTTINGWATGVYGTSKTYGVFGSAPTYGVVGEATYTGVYGKGSSYGVYSDGPVGTASTSAALTALPDNRVVELYSMASPENWFEDFGSGSLKAGVAEIALDPTFALAANSESNYHVFITPNGDCEGLYVATRTATGFEVRELRSGKSSVSFDFRIVAKRRGFESLRMEQLNHDAKTAQLIRDQAKNRPAQRTLMLDQPAQTKEPQNTSSVKPANAAPAM
jgi:hypothetical protein